MHCLLYSKHWNKNDKIAGPSGFSWSRWRNNVDLPPSLAYCIVSSF